LPCPRNYPCDSAHGVCTDAVSVQEVLGAALKLLSEIEGLDRRMVG